MNCQINWGIYILMIGLTGLAFIFRLLWVWKFDARDLDIRDLFFSLLVSIAWPLTYMLLLWTYIDENMSGTLLKGKKPK